MPERSQTEVSDESNGGLTLHLFHVELVPSLTLHHCLHHFLHTPATAHLALQLLKHAWRHRALIDTRMAETLECVR